MAGTNSSQSITFEKPAVILMEVQLEENIGMVMRTMLNFGFKKLRLVNPKVTWPNSKAISSSAGAYEIIGSDVQVYKSLESALHDIDVLCATSVRKRDMDSFVELPRKAIVDIKKTYALNSIAFLFGPEKAGLKNKDLSQANIIINIPTIKGFGSLNLAMSVNIICYEWFIQNNEIVLDNHFHKKDLAKKKEVDYFTSRLIRELQSSKFLLESDQQEKLTTNLKNIFGKNDLTNKELRILHGVITNLKKNKKSD